MTAAAMPAAGASDAPGWSMRLTSSTYFVGDVVNVSISGPGAFRGFVQLNWTDANGTVVDRIFVQLDANGTARAALRLPLNAATGTYHAVATVNANIVALREFEVIFDETNFLGKRISLLEKQLQDTNKQLSVQRDHARVLKEQYSWVWIFVVMAGFWLFITLIFTGFLHIPMLKMFVALRYPLGRFFNGRARALQSLFNVPSLDEPRFLYQDSRQYHAVMETDPMMIYELRRQGREPFELREWQRWREEHPVRIVKRRLHIRRIVKEGSR